MSDPSVSIMNSRTEIQERESLAVEKSELQGVVWGSTARLALVRGVIAGCIWSVLIPLYFDVPFSEYLATIFIITVGMPFSYVFLRFLNAILGWLAIYAIVLNLVSKIYSIAICVADPIIYFINKRYPHVFNVPHFGIVNFYMLILVKDPAVLN